ncbi:unnamed protein product [Dovyalis caffra]|uniref:Uncharacterized protein n=1 Tax=Dovyalis caffra TaxID=77055 RepID=A0AAV1RZA3_9ROSI|nr:unnamed protein product [Dovyalis caffra]
MELDAVQVHQRIHGIRFCTGAPGNNENKSQTRSKTPPILKLAVSGVTELLRVFSFSSTERLEKVNNKDRDEISVSGIDDVIMVLKSDYENAYFCAGLADFGLLVSLERISSPCLIPSTKQLCCALGVSSFTHLIAGCVPLFFSSAVGFLATGAALQGVFTSAIYAEDCIFEDPTIKFQGTELYSRNLKLLVPFFDCPSIGLRNIEKVASFEPIPDIFDSEHCFRQHMGVNSETYFVLATWKLRTYLKFPWRPLISIDGSTIYELDDKFKIVRHAESWNVSALQAIGQIFTPSFDRGGD